VTSANHELTRGVLLLRNFALNLGGWLVPALAALAAVPLLVRGLGDARFGVLALAWTALGYFSLFDLGIGRAVTHAVADGVGQDREQEIGTVVWTSLATLVPVGLVGTAVMLTLAPWLTSSLLNVPSDMHDETVAAFRILAIAIPFVSTAAALRGVLEARQMFGAINALRVPHGLLMFLGPVAALPFSRSLVPAVTILTLGRVALCIAHFVVCSRAVPHFGESGFRWNPGAVRHLLTFGGWMTVSNVISPLMNTLDRFVVGAALSVSVVTYYAAPSELVTKMWLFTAALHPVFFPAIATMGTREPKRTAAMFDRLLRVTFAGLLLPTMLLVLFARDILHVWLGPTFATESSTVLQVLAIAVFVNVLGQAALTFVQGLGRPDITGKLHVAELPLYAIALWLLLPRYGILGVALAWAGRASIDAIALLITCPRLLNEVRPSVQRTLVWLAIAVASLAACALLPTQVFRIGVAAIAIPLWLAVAWWRLLTPQERRAPARALNAALRPERA
jgi:O-antigen/teichoic acid export membrane protein